MEVTPELSITNSIMENARSTAIATATATATAIATDIVTDEERRVPGASVESSCIESNIGTGGTGTGTGTGVSVVSQCLPNNSISGTGTGPGTGTSESATSSAATTGKRGKKRKSKPPRDVKAPRPPHTGYVRYLNERREILKAEHPHLGFAEITRKLASEWGQLPVAEKQLYLDAAEIDREKYIKEWSAYKETEAYQEFRQQQLERKEGTGGTAAKKARASNNQHANKSNADKSIDSSASVNGSGCTTHGLNATPTIRTKANNLSSTNQNDGLSELDIPIFTEQFLQHNKLRETELRQLRKENTTFEQQNAIIQKYIDNVRGVLEKTKAETAAQVSRTAALRLHFNKLVDKLVSIFGSISLPGVGSGANKHNIDNYMETLRALNAENKYNVHVNQARELLMKIDIVT